VAQWFEGFDGQVVLDDDYVWILREGIPEALTGSADSASVRAHRGAVVGTDFRPATTTDLGVLRIRVAAKSGSAAHVETSEPVRFSLINNDRFSALGLLLSSNVEGVIEPVAAAEQLRIALDGLEGIATQAEIAEVLGEEPDVMQPVDGVTWSSVGSLWVAAGGTVDTEAGNRLQRITALQDLTRRLTANSGIKHLQSAVAMTPLNVLGPQRLCGLWKAVISEALPERTEAGPVRRRPRQRSRAQPVGWAPKRKQ